MYIIDRIANEKRIAHILPLLKDDFEKLTVRRHSFNWKKLEKVSYMYKLTLAGEDDILGVISLVDHFAEERIEIKLLAVSIENRGRNKQFDRIAGCLIAFAGREAIKKFKNYPSVSLIPKTELKRHYINKYGMIDAGWQLFIDETIVLNLISKYLA
ncbi:MAG: N-acetyltransferase [Bacteroidota bacterium]